MLFNSYIFIFIFLPITFFVYFYLNSKKLTIISKIFLISSSLFFYASGDIFYLPIILISILFNYIMGSILSQNKSVLKINRNLLLTFGIIANLSLLGYFKYANFFIENINILIHGHIPLLHLALPLAISFFTFQQIAYLVDSYKREIAAYSFLNYANFVTFFPQLIAGPIVHHSEMIPQFEQLKNKIHNHKNITMGLFIFAIGLFKKVVIADTFSFWVNSGFENPIPLNTFEAWMTSLSYTFQIYFDFSGYMDMAIGAALLFNIKLPINFDSPYKAINIQDFWKRWHITLSHFLKTYIYIPLGGNRYGKGHMFSNIMATFIIGGLWHGASWTFILWGFFHGIALIIYKLWEKYGFKLNNIFAWFITFNFINISWIFFRADSLQNALIILEKMFYFNNLGMINPLWILFLFLVLLSILFFRNSSEIIKTIHVNFLIAMGIGFIYAISLILIEMRGMSEFVYFKF